MHSSISRQYWFGNKVPSIGSYPSRQKQPAVPSCIVSNVRPSVQYDSYGINHISKSIKNQKRIPWRFFRQPWKQPSRICSLLLQAIHFDSCFPIVLESVSASVSVISFLQALQVAGQNNCFSWLVVHDSVVVVHQSAVLVHAVLCWDSCENR